MANRASLQTFNRAVTFHHKVTRFAVPKAGLHDDLKTGLSKHGT